MKTIDITCRRGVTYRIEAKGTDGEIARLKDMLEDSCCYVCYNHECKTPKKGKQPCKNECELFTKDPYCQRQAQKAQPKRKPLAQKAAEADGRSKCGPEYCKLWKICDSLSHDPEDLGRQIADLCSSRFRDGYQKGYHQAQKDDKTK